MKRIIWFTGLSGSGKTTLAKAVYYKLLAINKRVELLDGDEMRTHLCKDLGFSRQDRNENIRRISYVANLLAKNDIIVLVAVISPYRESRDKARLTAESIGIPFMEVFVNTPLSVCEARDPKGLYKRARAGEIKSFTGIDDPYEEPINPDVECYNATSISIEHYPTMIVDFLEMLETISDSDTVEYAI